MNPLNEKSLSFQQKHNISIIQASECSLLGLGRVKTQLNQEQSICKLVLKEEDYGSAGLSKIELKDDQSIICDLKNSPNQPKRCDVQINKGVLKQGNILANDNKISVNKIIINTKDSEHYKHNLDEIEKIDKSGKRLVKIKHKNYERGNFRYQIKYLETQKKSKPLFFDRTRTFNDLTNQSIQDKRNIGDADKNNYDVENYSDDGYDKKKSKYFTTHVIKIARPVLNNGKNGNEARNIDFKNMSMRLKK